MQVASRRLSALLSGRRAELVAFVYSIKPRYFASRIGKKGGMAMGASKSPLFASRGQASGTA